jgi:hypothetical protein
VSSFARLDKIKWSLALCGILGACGTYVPEIQEFPGSSVDGQLLVKEIVRNVHCEVKRAVTYVIDQDKKLAKLNGGARLAPWLENNWGVTIQLTLTIDEKGSVNPNLKYTPNPATALFTLGAGGAASSEATRIDTLYSFYTVKDLYSLPKNCAPANPAQGSFLLESDLKLRQWLVDTVLTSATGDVNYPSKIDGPLKDDVISHEVKFEVDTSGSITPTWTLTLVTINPDAPFLTASRNRTHDLIITLGPTDQASKRAGPGAASAGLSAAIGLAVSNGIKNSLKP